jgi:murein DD-endopeptidase MepM/ murein hydrolase activator NlpD
LTTAPLSPDAPPGGPDPPPSVRLLLSRGETFPGDFLYAAFHVARQGDITKKYELLLQNPSGKNVHRLPFSLYTQAGGGALYLCFFAVPSLAARGDYEVSVYERPPVPLAINPVTNPKVARAGLAVLPKTFPTEEIPLNPSNTKIRTEQTPEQKTQVDELWTVFNRTGNDFFDFSAFSYPVPADTTRTSEFGSRRVYVYSTGGRDTAVHAGIDFRASTGTPVLSCGRGRIVLSKYRVSTGYSILVEHLPGIYSIYYHLSKLGVRENDMVEAGTLLGESGATGLATGPHLHWEIRVHGENTNADSMTSSPLLDKTVLYGILGIGE